MAKTFTWAEVSRHNTNKDCWLLINGKVYDVTKFLGEHPGGEDVLVFATGKDSTPEFEEVGHSATAKKRMEEFYLGDIDTSTGEHIPSVPPPEKLQTNTFERQIMQFFLPLIVLIIALALALRFYTR
ncbi:hypothetical protein M569_09892 [Genlisea aurea]|uniref:Cytochrome b5 heme-binding domain-containing protein n=1 Tax=Genlisea aurea TaxID=192259 RepID=S8CD76_9LAMI|nr:hypothetical protein M569_09892 [Genlisea aurea]